MKANIKQFFTASWVILLLLLAAPVWAQQEAGDYIDDDPLKKPTIWAKLENQPNNEGLWAQYFGRDLFSMSKEEIKMYDALKNKLQQADRKRQELVEFIKMQRRSEGQKQFGEDVKLDPYYYTLVGNVVQNFAMIEDYFVEKFKEVNLEYFRYEMMHSGTDYSHTQWVDEQEKRLKEGVAAKQEMEEMKNARRQDY